MTRTDRTRLAVAVVATFFVAAFPRTARPCASVSAHDAVGITREEAIVFWDPGARQERFLRRAQFRSNATDFGFLVPTPTRPALEEASDDAFAALDHVVENARAHVTETEWSPGCAVLGTASRSKSASIEAAAPAPATVTVLETKTVAGLDAAVLEATDEGALTAWLAAHGYATRPEITAWLAPYVAQKWKITAFKYAGREGRPIGELLSKSVMLTFTSEQPIYPYREPSDTAPEAGRLLRVFLIAPGRMDARLGDASWDVQRIFAAPLAGRDAPIAGVVPAGVVPRDAWLTVMDDRAAVRTGARDVTFVPSAERTEILPPPIVGRRVIVIPLELGIVVLVIALLCIRVIRRRVPAPGNER